MTTKTVKNFIPARICDSTVYIADDGREFYYEEECKQYEEYQEMMDHYVFANQIEGVRTYDDEHSATLYHIRDESDLKFWMEARYMQDVITDFSKFGPGWYIFYYVDGGDHADSDYLLNYNNYETEQEKEFNDWKQDIRSKIKHAEQNIA